MSPCATTSATQSKLREGVGQRRRRRSRWRSGRGRGRSRARRRTLPASETCSAAAGARQRSDDVEHGGQACPSRRRAGASASRARCERLQHFSSIFAPEPGQRAQPLLLGRLPQLRRASSRPSSSQMRARRLRPEARQAHERDDLRPGRAARRLVRASISPFSTIWTIFSSIVLPIPCSSFARPSSASCGDRARGVPDPLWRPGGRRGRGTTARPRSSSRSASSSNCSATSAFRGSAAATVAMIRTNTGNPWFPREPPPSAAPRQTLRGLRPASLAAPTPPRCASIARSNESRRRSSASPPTTSARTSSRWCARSRERARRRTTACS